MTRRKPWIGVAAGVGLALAAVAAMNLHEAREDPIVRRGAVGLPDWPAAAPPVDVVLLGDIHIGSPTMDAARLTRIVAQVNALHPDLVLIAGDGVFGHDPANGARYARLLTAPLGGLRARLGAIAVLGNHDHWTAPTEVIAALRRAGITVLANAAAARGPLAVIGIDDAFSGHDDVPAALNPAHLPPSARIVLTHAPDVLAALPAEAAALVLTAHTHCGQVVMPVTGWFVSRSPLPGRRLFDPRYRCGIVHDPYRSVIVTAGLGTSIAPLRIGAPPDLWLLRLGPRPRP